MLRNFHFGHFIGIVLCLILLSTVFLSIPAQVSAADVVPIRIADFQVNTIDGKSLSDQFLMAGSSYNIQFTLEIAAGIKEKGIIKTALSQTGDHFWSIEGQYAGIDTRNWQPGQPMVAFDAIEGKVKMVLQGKVPDDYVLIKSPSGATLHNSRQISLLELSLASGKVLEGRSQEVIDKSIETYRSLLQNREKLVAQTQADSRYVDMVKLVVNSSKIQADNGYVDQATTMLQSIPQSGWITPQSSSFYQWIIAGVLAIIAILLAMVLFRARNDLAFTRRRVDDQAKNLEVLNSRVRGIGDTKLAGEFDKVKDELEQISGR
jgi:hypothetical protein